jgi:thiamine biosynthesis protein ThiS
MGEIRLTVNGEERAVPAGTTLQALVESLGVDKGRVACEVNLSIVRRADYPRTALRAGDTVEIVQMIGGG